MVDAKGVADLITLARVLLGLILAWLGVAWGASSLSTAVWLLVLDWLGDLTDGACARRSRVKRTTWIGEHDLEVDMFVSLGVLVFLVAAGYVGLWIACFYLIGWAWYFGKYGLLRSPGMLFQAPIYGWFSWVALHEIPILGYGICLFLFAVIVLTWPRFPRDVVPGFVAGMRAAWKLAPSMHARHKH